MNDLISRQAAIDALKEHRKLFCDNTQDTFSKLSYPEKCRVDELDTAIATLVNLPSAQSEIIRCKDCIYYTPMNRETKTGICNLIMHQNFGDNWFCAGAKRRINDANVNT